jgi:hypothetical protein
MRLMYVTVRPIWQGVVPNSFPLPATGEEIEIYEKRYRVTSRTWDIQMPIKLGGVDETMGVAIHVREV